MRSRGWRSRSSRNRKRSSIAWIIGPACRRAGRASPTGTTTTDSPGWLSRIAVPDAAQPLLQARRTASLRSSSLRSASRGAGSTTAVMRRSRASSSADDVERRDRPREAAQRQLADRVG